MASAAAAKKWPRPFQPGSSVADEAEVGLVDQGGGLERLAGLLPGQPPGGELAQLVVDQGQELLGGPRLALLDRREDAGDVVHAGRCPGPSDRAAPTTGPGATRPGSRDRQRLGWPPSRIRPQDMFG